MLPKDWSSLWSSWSAWKKAFFRIRGPSDPDEIEEERRLCYVGMTRAMDTLVLSSARYRRRYGTDMPEATVPSRFLEEVPGRCSKNWATSRGDKPRT